MIRLDAIYASVLQQGQGLRGPPCNPHPSTPIVGHMEGGRKEGGRKEGGRKEGGRKEGGEGKEKKQTN